MPRAPQPSAHPGPPPACDQPAAVSVHDPSSRTGLCHWPLLTLKQQQRGWGELEVWVGPQFLPLETMSQGQAQFLFGPPFLITKGDNPAISQPALQAPRHPNSWGVDMGQ